MKAKLIVILTVLLTSTWAEAGPARCAFIKNTDDRYVCYALTTKSSTWCAMVKDRDKRNMCYVLLGK